MAYKPIEIPVSKALDEAAWQVERMKRVTATDAPRILGIAPPSWGGALSVFLEKVGQAAPKQISEAMEMGEWMEDSIARLFEHKKGYKVKPSNVLLVHPKFTFMGCNLDRWTDDGQEVPLEVKNVGEYALAEWEKGVPEHYLIQVQHQLCVTDKPYAYIAAVIGGNKFRSHKVLRDDLLIDELVEAERKFWNLVETGTPPSIDASPEAEQVLRYVYPTSTEGKTFDLDSDLQDVYRKLTQARAGEALLKEEIQGYKNRIMEAMGDAEAAYVPGQEKPVITYRGSVTRRFNSTRFTSENPELAAPYYVESSSRRFLVKGEEE